MFCIKSFLFKLEVVRKKILMTVLLFALAFSAQITTIFADEPSNKSTVLITDNSGLGDDSTSILKKYVIDGNGLWKSFGGFFGSIGLAKDDVEVLFNLNLGIVCVILNHVFEPGKIPLKLLEYAWDMRREIGHTVLALSGVAVNLIGKMFKGKLGKAGAAAGDNVNDEWANPFGYRVWGSVFGGNTRQKTTNAVDGSKGTTAGIVIAADVDINDDFTLGSSIIVVDSTEKSLSDYVTKTTKSRSGHISLYSIYNFTDNIYINTMLGYGISAIDIDSQLRPCPFSEKKYPIYFSPIVHNFSGNASLNYSIKVNDRLIITPEVGIKIIQLFAKSYNEKSLDESITARLAHVKATHGINASSVFGISAAALAISNEKMHLVTEAHAQLDVDIKNSKKKVNISYSALGIGYNIKPVNKKSRVINFGFVANLLSGSKTYDLKLKYDRFIAKKFISNQGSIELGINF